MFRSNDGGGSFQQVSTPPASRPTTCEPLGDLGLQFTGAERGVAFVGSSVLVTIDGAKSGITGARTGRRTMGLLLEREHCRYHDDRVGRVRLRHPLRERLELPVVPLVRSTNWFTSWVEVPAPDSGRFNAAGGISLSAFGRDVWIVVGNGNPS